MLALQRLGSEAGSRRGALCRDLRILICGFGVQSAGSVAASYKGADIALRWNKRCGLSDHAAVAAPWSGRQRYVFTFQSSWWHKGVSGGVLPAHAHFRQELPVGLKPKAGLLYQRLDACLSSSSYSHQGIGTLLPCYHWNKNKPQTSYSGLSHWQPQNLSARWRQRWFLKTQSWAYSQSVPGHICATSPWWHLQLPSLGSSIRTSSRGYRNTSHPEGAECRVVDLRSDTVTRPSPEMRQAMAQAEVGDDDYGEDPTVNELQKVVADLLGMEDALFVPSATMANLIAVMCHCHRRGAQLLLGKASHIHVFEHGGVAQVAGIHSEILQDLPDGTINLEEMECKIQQAYQSRYYPRPELICLENTHCSAGGRVLPLRYLQEVHQLAKQYGLRIHLDGARILNAAVALGVKPILISQHCDSVTLCLSKGVGAPAGALLAGDKELIDEAWRVRKLLGGGMRQAGVLAAAALIGLRHVEDTLKKDHNNARDFAQGVCSLGSSLCSVNPATVETNIVMVTILAPWLTAVKLCELMETVSAQEIAATSQAISVRLFPWGERCLRLVWNCDVSPDDTQLAGNKLRFVLDNCKQQQPST